MDCSKSDWKLFRERLSGWQEAYMDRLNCEYIEILRGEGNPSDKFWTLEKRIRQDKRHPGVQVEMRRSTVESVLVALLMDGVIMQEDLSGFSTELQEKVQYWANRAAEDNNN
ncbi:MAG: multidrug transporter [Oscillospiraceae bacterium]|nr:multidrug transporter [Oscillospiraceae bacterium]